MNEEELNNIQEIIERKILLGEVSGGLTSSDKKFINLWNYTIELQQEKQLLKDRINKAINKIEKLYSFNYNDKLTCDEIRKTLLILKGEK